MERREPWPLSVSATSCSAPLVPISFLESRSCAQARSDAHFSPGPRTCAAVCVLLAALVAARPATGVEAATPARQLAPSLRLRGGGWLGGAPAPQGGSKCAAKAVDLSGDGGVLMTSLVPGTGGMCPQSDAHVFCHVRGHYVVGSPQAAPVNDSKMQLFFDSRGSGDAGSDAPVQLMLSDAGNMLESSLQVEALARAVKKMRVREHARVVASSAYAFGATGCNAPHAGWVGGQVVPANATVVFDVELLRFGEENVLQDAFGSVLVTYLREWPPASPIPSQGPVPGAGCFFDAYAARAPWAPWRKLRRGVGWRTAFSGGDVEKVQVLLKFVAVDASGRLIDWSGRGGDGCAAKEHLQGPAGGIRVCECVGG